MVGLNYSPEPTGIAPYTTSLANGLADRGHCVVVKTTHPHYPDWRIRSGYGRWSQSENLAGVHVQRLLHYVPQQPSSLRRVLSELSFGVRAVCSRWGSPDLVILVSPALFSSAVAAVKMRMMLRSVPHVVWVQDIYGLGVAETGAGGGRLAKLISSLESMVLRSASGVAVIHDRFAEHVEKRLRVQSSRVRVVRNWTHLEELDLPPRETTRLSLGWGTDLMVALHAGNMGVKQGLENVVRAARLAEERGDNVRFVLLGKGNQRDKIELLARGLKNIQFIDPLPDLEYQATMAAADALIVNEKPGLAEMAVPSKLTSYFSTGLPIIAATDLGSVTAGEVETSGGGIRVDAGDPTALLDAVVRLGNNPDEGQAMGARGLQFRISVLAESAAITNFDSWISSLAASRRPEPTP
ncbi:Glycosyltransferase involved in cell wall bisynthesis [Agreia bicolorata]|uniref:D-inositol 3-phosphate glycosyltransferase n=2 Tax=Agreia bicolorata TaxID=110935 RepID=A0A1T4WY44_9MICO|nr:Glycosyltransferase involved in cell wall bisynthesis [Agreia bicolorata]